MNAEEIIKDLTNEELSELAEKIRFKRYDFECDRIKKTIKEHQQYVGKCYKRDYMAGNFRYVKLIASASRNEYWMEVLVFENPIQYRHPHTIHKISKPGDGVFGEIEYKGIRVESVNWFTIAQPHGYEEISLEEYNEAMDKHVKMLKETKWE